MNIPVTYNMLRQAGKEAAVTLMAIEYKILPCDMESALDAINPILNRGVGADGLPTYKTLLNSEKTLLEKAINRLNNFQTPLKAYKPKFKQELTHQFIKVL